MPFHALDAYATFNVTDNLTFAFEGDYVINRGFRNSPPLRVTGGVAYARYQFTPHFAMAGRFEYLSDRVGLFSGLAQALKEHTWRSTNSAKASCCAASTGATIPICPSF